MTLVLGGYHSNYSSHAGEKEKSYDVCNAIKMMMWGEIWDRLRHGGAQCTSRVLIDDIAYADSRGYLHEVGRYTTIKALQALFADDVAKKGDHAVWLSARFGLKSRPYQSQRVAGYLTTGAAHRAARE